MRKDDLINSIEPIIDEITEINKKIENVKTIKGDTGEKGEQGEKGDKGETGETGIGYNSKEWTQGIHRQGQIVQHFIGQQYKALKDTDKEPPHEDWERVGTSGFRWTGIKNDKTEYKDGDLFIDSGTTFLVVDGKAKMFAQRGRDGKHGQDGKDGKSAREFVHVKWTDNSISFVYDDGEIVEADIEGLTEIQKRLTFLDDMFSDYQNIDAPIKRYAGAYVPKNSYAKGDTASNAKSLYLCVKDDPNSSSLDPEKWIVLCNAQGGGGGGGKGEFLPLAGGTMTGTIGSTAGDLMRLKSLVHQVITTVENTGGLTLDLPDSINAGFEIVSANKKALSVNGKKIIEASKEQDDELVKLTASDYYLTTRKYVLDRVRENYNLIVDLETEIDAISPASERGVWRVEDVTTNFRPPNTPGSFYLMDAKDVNNIVITRDLAAANTIVISHTDDQGAAHAFTSAKVGDHIEVFEGADKDYALGKITAIDRGAADYTIFTYTVESSLGSLAGTDIKARVKIFDLAAGLLLESLMPKTGGTFTGSVFTDRGNFLIKTANKSTGTNFSVTNGNDFQQLKINGYGNFSYNKSATPANQMDDNTVATMGDVNNISLHTLASFDNYQFRSPKSLDTTEFAANTGSVNSLTKIYLYILKNSDGNNQYVKDYEPTPSTEFRIYYPSTGELVFTTLVKNWATSNYSSSDRMFDVPSYGCFYKLGYSMSTSNSYRVMLTNMKKLPATRITALDPDKEKELAKETKK